MTACCKSWRGPNALGPRDLQSWKGRVPRVAPGGCAVCRRGIIVATRNQRFTAAASREFQQRLYFGNLVAHDGQHQDVDRTARGRVSPNDRGQR